MPRTPSAEQPSRQRPRSTAARVARGARMVFAAAAILTALLPAASPVAAAEGLVMEARVLLEGQARVGAWMAIEVRLTNSGPPVVGELRLATTQDARTRFSTPVDLPTTSDKTYVLYAQPPSSFGSSLKVTLVAGDSVVSEKTVDFVINDSSRLVVGVVAERPEAIVPTLNLLPAAANGQLPTVLALEIADLPERVEAWGALDRLVWQDIDTVDLSGGQVAALRGWLAGGGQLVIAGGSAGPAALSGFPEDILPYRPAATVDVPPETVSGLIGQLPEDAADLPVLAGELVRGRALASSGDRTIAAETPYGTGVVTILGFDPTTRWITEAETTETMWRRYLPPRSGTAFVTTDDGQLVNAVSQLPNLALPPITGLLVLLLGYIILIGPVNYLVLRRLDRREWAWVTMPVLIAVFAAGSYGFGAALRGLDVVINEVAIVRGSPNATEGTAQVYLGVFSPSRGTYQVEVPGGALLSSTLTGDFINAGSAGVLDVLQGDTARVRNLSIGFGSLRTLRAETATTVPLIQANLLFKDGTLSGTITNGSDKVLEKPAVVLGSSVVVLQDLAPGTTQSISMPVRPNQFGESLSNRILGQIFFRDPTGAGDSTSRNIVRHAVIDQLTFDPNFGSSTKLQSDTPVLLAWGTDQVLDIRISGQAPRRTGNVLYYVPLGMKIQGRTAFDGDLIRSSVVEVDGGMFGKDRSTINMGQGSVTLAYSPIAFDGNLTATRVTFGLNWGGEEGNVGGAVRVVEPLDPQPCRDEETDPDDCAEPEPVEPCDPNVRDCFIESIPSVEVFDRTGSGTWLRLPAFAMGNNYDLANPDRYVDPGSGALLVRFVNERPEGANFGFQVRIEGTVE